MENKRSILAGQKGFTLIEVIAVLVILGVLAAVAIPKYMDMQTDAQIAAVNGALAAAASTATMAYAKKLVTGAWPFAAADMATSVGDFTAGYVVTGCATASAACSVAITISAGPSWFAASTATKTKTVLIQ